VLFQPPMNPIRLMLGVEIAFTWGGMFADGAMRDPKASILRSQTQNLLLAISELPLYDEIPGHGWHVEPAIEGEYSSLIRIDRYGRVMNWALVRRMCRHERIVRVRGAYSEGMVFVGWVIEVDHQGVAFVHGYDT
jgi:hypothetical protein